MGNAMETLLTRRSVRKYKPDMVPRDVIEAIMEAGLYAANGMGKQATVIVAVTNREVRERLAEENRRIGGWEAGFDPFYGAPVVLIVLAEKDWPIRVYDGSCVMENLMLAAHAQGVSSCWVHRAKEEFELPAWQDWLKDLGLRGEYEGIGHCILGYADGDAPEAAERRPGRTFFVE
ncbi:MAG: nitroreductase [Ruminiclostridium sp.]|nr:nitroreductase [Ruminiclostridium sp.]